jgi:hypothetical protein
MLEHETGMRACLAFKRKLAVRKLVEEALEAEVAEAVGRDSHGGKVPSRRRRSPRASAAMAEHMGMDMKRFCQVVEVETLIRQAGASPRSYPPVRQLAPCR